MKAKISFKQIQDEVDQIRDTYPKLRDDSAFVLWFLRAYLTDSEDEARRSLTGDKSDKEIDAILIDHRAKQVHLVQGKFRQSIGDHAETHSEVLNFATLSTYPWGTKDTLAAFYSDLNALVKQKFGELIHYVRKRHYSFQLYYVTTGRCSPTIQSEAKQRVREADGPAAIEILDASQIVTVFRDYLEGVAPAVRTLSLRIASEPTIQTKGVIHRFDPQRKIESWVFSMSTKNVGEMFNSAGTRLFARNVRGWLGEKTEINESMAKTIRDEPRNFWYYNNGVTIVCDDAKEEIHGGQDFLRVDRPQVINGQQTTRALSENLSERASVLLKVFKIPRNPGDDDDYDDLVSSIVRATNWQNAIMPSDLVSNDHIQVFLERELRKRGYQYLRKRMSKSEAKRLIGKGYYQIKKGEMAQAIAGCDLAPDIVRSGKEGLFDVRYYRSIFGSRSVSYYLSRWWLMRKVQYVARGYPERAYAKWVVLNFAWSKLEEHLGSGEGERKFRQVCEYDSYDTLRHLHKALTGMFREALAFYRAERGIGEEAKDVSTFFKVKKLDERFHTFWNSSKNRHRLEVESKIRRFERALHEVELRA